MYLYRPPGGRWGRRGAAVSWRERLKKPRRPARQLLRQDDRPKLLIVGYPYLLIVDACATALHSQSPHMVVGPSAYLLFVM